MSSFAHELKAIRNRLGLTQSEFAVLVGLADSTISRLENSVRRPPARSQFWDKLKQVPGMTEEDILNLRSAAEMSWTGESVGWFEEVDSQAGAASFVEEDLQVSLRVYSVMLSKQDLENLASWIAEDVKQLLQERERRHNRLLNEE